MIISQTPLRISFVGGGTDFPDFYLQYGGSVLSTAIDKYVYVIVMSRYDSKIVLNYSEKEVVENVCDIRHQLIKEAMLKVGIRKGVEITTIADIPSSGSGLGSSSSLSVGLFTSLYQYVGKLKNNYEIAEEACDLEINRLKSPIGKQDQYAASFGGFKLYKFQKTGQIEVEELKIDLGTILELESQLFLVYTNITRTANGILSEQSKNIKQNLNIEHLRELAKMPFKLKEEIEKDNLKSLGEYLKINWELKKKLAKGITSPEIESLVDLGLSNGALGAKLLGAGGGGFVLFFVPGGAHDKFIRAIKASEYKMLPIKFERFGTRIILNNGRNHHFI
ncbi:MAG TPA: hypothetical protein VHO03_03020 [Ignavibacteriales bacterium]|nr:hypothetical protein [Ignavibacteriales bacterium]